MCDHMLTVKHAQLNFNPSGIPYASDYQDTYFSQAGALDECQHVFINGNQLTQRWQQKHFTIAELGFGCGINFLTTASAWLKQARSNSRLHFISFEKHPIKPQDLEKVHALLECDTKLSEQLITHYPPPVCGKHRLHFANNRITLTLIFGDALEQIERCDFEADAWFLDGFSPSKNPALWCEDIAQLIFKLTKHEGTFSTYSVAGVVKRNLTQAGFECEKIAGFAQKNHMLVGKCHKPESHKVFHYRDKSWLHTRPNLIKKDPQRAIIIGAGMAGFSIAHSLAERGWQCTILDRHHSIAMEGSGNQNAILMPRLSVDHDIQSQLTLQGFLYSLQRFKQLDQVSKQTLWHSCGAIQIPRDEMQASRMQQIVDNETIPEELLRVVTQQQAAQLTACPVNRGGWYIPQAGWIVPEQLCQALWDQYSDRIQFKGGQEVSQIRQETSCWQALVNDQVVAEAEHVVIANAHSSHQFEQTTWCKMHPKRGQVTHIPQQFSTLHPEKIICSDVYLTPAVNQEYVLGASFITADRDTSIRQSEHEDNITKLNKILHPSDDSICISEQLNTVGGRVGIRAVSSDRLPVIGQVVQHTKFLDNYSAIATGNTRLQYLQPDYYSGLYIATGFGSRGLAWIPLCAEALACTMNNEPSPLTKGIARACHPNRILVKRLMDNAKPPRRINND